MQLDGTGEVKYKVTDRYCSMCDCPLENGIGLPTLLLLSDIAFSVSSL